MDEVYQAESFIRRQVRDARHQMLLCERLQEVAENPCVRYGVTDLGTIGERRRGLLPTIQMCGRGLRKADGKTHCNVVQSAKTKYLFERVTPAQKRFRLMNGQWMALQDGTEMIEKTLKLSLALLERREKMRARRKDRQRGRSRPRAASAPPRSGEAMSFGGRYNLPPFYREFEDVYRRRRRQTRSVGMKMEIYSARIMLGSYS